MNDTLRIELPAHSTTEHQRLILKYLISGRQSLTFGEWRQLFTGFDLLHRARVKSEKDVQTFRQIYDAHVEQPFADGYINELLLLKDVSREHQALRARYARRIVDSLNQANLRRSDVEASNLLLAYCLYFWESFALGYAFEVGIYRDLINSGIEFKAHDIRDRAARFSAYDLQILSLKGDVKTSLYFLHAARSRDLAHDFYITRFYEGKQQRTLVVLMHSSAWDQINGDTIKGILEEATKQFPVPVMVQIEDRPIVIMEYNVWKGTRVRKTTPITGNNMGEQIITNMPTDEFDAVVDAYIERETKDMGELDAPLFYEALREFVISDTINAVEVEGEIVDNQLVLDLPADLKSSDQMREIALLVGKRRIPVKWKDDTIYPTAH